jgi:hypothetical protein
MTQLLVFVMAETSGSILIGTPTAMRRAMKNAAGEWVTVADE